MRRFLALVLMFVLFLPLDACAPTDVREIPLQDALMTHEQQTFVI